MDESLKEPLERLHPTGHYLVGQSPTYLACDCDLTPYLRYFLTPLLFWWEVM